MNRTYMQDTDFLRRFILGHQFMMKVTTSGKNSKKWILIIHLAISRSITNVTDKRTDTGTDRHIPRLRKIHGHRS